MKLPVVRGSNLLRQNMQLPEDLSGNLNLLFIPFHQWQQMEVNSWVPLVSELEQIHADFHYYELPTIQRRNVFSQVFINEGMRMGIPDPATRKRTITLYIDKKAFMDALDMHDEEHTYLLLTDREGSVLWQARGEYTVEKAASLKLAVEVLSAQTNTA